MVASDDPIRKYEPLWGNWQVAERLGEGSYGRVYRVVRQDGGSYESAVKLISIPRNETELQEARHMGMDLCSISAYLAETAERIVKEIRIMHSLKGEANIVSYEDHQIFHEEGSLQWDILIRMELLIPLETYVSDNAFDPDEVRRLGIEICSALETCAAYGIIHRDIKEANLFLTARGTFKLGDFGIAREMGGMGNHSMSMRGTPAYIAPEVYNGCKYDERADIYSLGILMYKLLNAGRYPFLPPAPNPITLEDAEQAFARRIKGEIPALPLHGDSALRAAVMRAISFDPHARYQSAADFKSALSHASSAPPSKTSYQKPATADAGVRANAPPPSARHAQETVYRPYAANPSTKIEHLPNTSGLGKKSKFALILSGVMLTLTLVIIFSMLLPKLLRPNTEENEDVATSIFSIHTAPDPNAVVSWADPVMGELVSRALRKSQEELTYGDLANIKELYINGDQATTSYDEYSKWQRALYEGCIQTLRDLQYFTNLEKLCIYDQNQDSLKPLSNLKKLQQLSLVDCERPDLLKSDVSPLANLTELRKLVLTECRVDNLSSLRSLTNLRELYLSDLSGFEDLSFVSDMSQLISLTAKGSSIQCIPDLSRLSSLTRLILKDCAITDISALAGMTTLLELDLRRNQITSLQGLQGLIHLDHLYLSENNFTNIEVLSTLDSVIWLEIEDIEITDFSPLLKMDALKYLFADRTAPFLSVENLLENKRIDVTAYRKRRRTMV